MRTNRSSIVLVVIATAFLAASRLPAADSSQRWAVLIGVNDYVQLEDLKFPGEDVEALGKRLSSLGFPARQVFTLHDRVQDNERRPFKSNVQKKLDLVLKLADQDDVVLIAFSGHGMHIDGTTYLCPSEADIENPQSSMIAVDDIYSQLQRSPAALRLLVLDACRDDPRPKGQKSATAMEDSKELAATFERPPDGIWLLSSCGPDQISYEDPDLKHGVFMHYMVKGLAGAADEEGNRNGKISLGELHEYTSLETKVHVANKWGGAQIPALRGEINGTFELVPSVMVPGRVITNSIGMNLVLVPAGEFEMGTSTTNAEFLAHFPGLKAETVEGFVDERPVHSVQITRPFYLGQNEVTLGQFLKFYHDAKYRTDAEKDGKGGLGWTGAEFKQSPEFVAWSWGHPDQAKQHPVVNVSWNDATEFCSWLSRKEGKRYRLPTEAEWEYACRAGTGTLYPHGDDPEGLALVGNVGDATAGAAFSWARGGVIESHDGHRFSAPVGQFRPNRLGLFDMQGNAGEWCSDWYSKTSYSSSPSTDPTGPASGSQRVIRGGGWRTLSWAIRSAYRGANVPTFRDCAVGFRVVLVEAESPRESPPPSITLVDSRRRDASPPPAPSPAPAQTAEVPVRRRPDGFNGATRDVLVNSIGMTLVAIPPGRFEMGTTENAAELLEVYPSAKAADFNDERPAHWVEIERGFYLGENEVTLSEFLKFYHDAKYRIEAEKDGTGGHGWTGKEFKQSPEFVPWSWGHSEQTPEHPVVNVSWNDASEFCRWLSQKEGRTYRLPTEAEWEYACRAGTKTRYHHGDDPEGLSRSGNAADATAKEKFPSWRGIQSSDRHLFTAPVCQFEPNAFGLFDMHGNVCEWCQDWYLQSYYPQSPSTDPTGPDSGKHRVVRGGGWMDRPWQARSAFRWYGEPTHRASTIGFRVALITAGPPRAAGTEAPASRGITAARGVTAAASEAASARSVKPGTVITNSIGMDFVSIPPGEFDMGSRESPIALSAAMPAHTVRIASPFYLGVHEVTLSQFLSFYHAAKYQTDAEKDSKGGWGWTGTEFVQRPDFVPWNWGHDSDAKNYPVVNVSWNDATAFCQWLSKKEGKNYRLPTEAEWEYACRAGAKTRYSFGSDSEQLARHANVADAVAKARWSQLTAIQASDGHAFTAPVGSYLPNAFGLFDMHGNASEWCSDWFDENYYDAAPPVDPTGPSSGTRRVLRGGSWYNQAFYCRSAYRSGFTPENRNLYTGFRVLLVPDPGP